MVQPRRYPEDERNIMREDEIAALPTEEERRREVRNARLCYWLLSSSLQ